MQDDALLTGLQDHLMRARLFLHEARTSADPTDRMHRLLAAVYSAQAFVEVIETAANDGKTNMLAKELMPRVRPMLPHSEVIYRLRIHDFHRHPIQYIDGLQMLGPVQLVARQKGGVAAIMATAEGIEKIATKNSAVEEDRPLFLTRFAVSWGDGSGSVSIDDALDSFLNAAPEVLKLFRSVYFLTAENPASSGGAG